MVYTVTFNPALDYVVFLDALQPGDINRTRREEIQFGGKGVNVSTVLAALGVPTVALGFVAGFTGRALEDGLAQNGIATDFIHLPVGMTRINVKVKAGEETEINARGPVIPPEAIQALFARLDDLVAGDALVLSGSVPASLPHDIYQRILTRLHGKDILCVVDASGELLRATLPHRPFLIKPNRQELEQLFRTPLPTDDAIAAAADALRAEGARNVLVSLAGEGSLLVDETGARQRLGAPKGTVRNSVGAGDSMVAGFLAGWLATGDHTTAHRLGTAAGAATAFSDGLADAAAIQALLCAF